MRVDQILKGKGLDPFQHSAQLEALFALPRSSAPLEQLLRQFHPLPPDPVLKLCSIAIRCSICEHSLANASYPLQALQTQLCELPPVHDIISTFNSFYLAGLAVETYLLRWQVVGFKQKDDQTIVTLLRWLLNAKEGADEVERKSKRRLVKLLVYTLCNYFSKVKSPRSRELTLFIGLLSREIIPFLRKNTLIAIVFRVLKLVSILPSHQEEHSQLRGFLEAAHCDCNPREPSYYSLVKLAQSISQSQIFKGNGHSFAHHMLRLNALTNKCREDFRKIGNQKLGAVIQLLGAKLGKPLLSAGCVRQVVSRIDCSDTARVVSALQLCELRKYKAAEVLLQPVLFRTTPGLSKELATLLCARFALSQGQHHKALSLVLRLKQTATYLRPHFLTRIVGQVLAASAVSQPLWLKRQQLLQEARDHLILGQEGDFRASLTLSWLQNQQRSEESLALAKKLYLSIPGEERCLLAYSCAAISAGKLTTATSLVRQLKRESNHAIAPFLHILLLLQKFAEKLFHSEEYFASGNNRQLMRLVALQQYREIAPQVRELALQYLSLASGVEERLLRTSELSYTQVSRLSAAALTLAATYQRYSLLAQIETLLPMMAPLPQTHFRAVLAEQSDVSLAIELWSGNLEFALSKRSLGRALLDKDPEFAKALQREYDISKEAQLLPLQQTLPYFLGDLYLE